MTGWMEMGPGIPRGSPALASVRRPSHAFGYTLVSIPRQEAAHHSFLKGSSLTLDSGAAWSSGPVGACSTPSLGKAS